MNISKNLLIEGWRGINHSYAMINQYQIRELLKNNNLNTTIRIEKYLNNFTIILKNFIGISLTQHLFQNN